MKSSSCQPCMALPARACPRPSPAAPGGRRRCLGRHGQQPAAWWQGGWQPACKAGAAAAARAGQRPSAGSTQAFQGPLTPRACCSAVGRRVFTVLFLPPSPLPCSSSSECGGGGSSCGRWAPPSLPTADWIALMQQCRMPALARAAASHLACATNLLLTLTLARTPPLPDSSRPLQPPPRQPGEAQLPA